MRLCPRVLFCFLVAGWGMSAAAALAPLRDRSAELRAVLAQSLDEERAHPDQAAVLQKVARAYSDLCDYQPSAASAQDFARHALKYAQAAARLDPANAEHTVSIAIAWGKLGLWGSASEKVACARQVYEAARRAEQLDPNYSWAHHVLGRWQREVANLNGATRLCVRWFLGGLPPASNAESVKELRRATELEPAEPAHWIELGFAEQAAGHADAAEAAWRRGLAMPGNAPYQDEARARAEKALAAGSRAGSG